MKTIKFRGRDDTGYPHYGDLTHEGKDVLVDDVEVDPESVAQFIGCDKDGNEIYEGDEIKSHFGQTCRASFRHYGEIQDGQYTFTGVRK